MQNVTARAPTDGEKRERVVRAAVTTVYDRYCSGSIADLEDAVVALMGRPIPSDDESEEAA